MIRILLLIIKMKKFISWFDLSPAHYQPRVNHKHAYRSWICGLASLFLLVILALFLFLEVLNSIAGKEHLTSTTYAVNDFNITNTQDMDFQICVRMYQKSGQPVLINILNQYQNGLNLTGNQHMNIRENQFINKVFPLAAINNISSCFFVPEEERALYFS